MSVFKLYGQCEMQGPKHSGFFIRHRKVPIVGAGITARSRSPMCGSCYRKLLKILKPHGHDNNE